MKKVLITGGSGTVGTAFINEYYNEYDFYNISRNETYISNLSRDFPKVVSYIGDICNLETLINVFEAVKPDIVIHAAAMKHVNLAEEQPTKAIEMNVVGSLNVIRASIRAKVPLTIGVSTDKACDSDSVYGYTKRMMELMFMNSYNTSTKFICTRFANVAGSNGSVIPFWKRLAIDSKALKLTDPKMNRLMFSKRDAAELIHDAIWHADKCTFRESFIMSKKMKTVNMHELAKVISNDIEIIGKRPGEKVNETLVSEKELSYTTIIDDSVFIFNGKTGDRQLQEEHSSVTAEHMTIAEMKKLIE
jgi:FlaA1/EpsC-like NDP-sugar epimerase